MSAVTDLLSECKAAGVELYLDTGRLRYRARAGVYTEALRQKVAAHKAALIALLQVPTPTTPAATPTFGQAPAVSATVKYTRRRALASAPPQPAPLTGVHYAARAFLYSVIQDGFVTRATLVSQDLKTEPEALAFLKRRFPGVTVQWARVIQHPVCGGCQHFTGGVLCTIDLSPDYAARVGSCGQYERAGEL